MDGEACVAFYTGPGFPAHRGMEKTTVIFFQPVITVSWGICPNCKQLMYTFSFLSRPKVPLGSELHQAPYSTRYIHTYQMLT